VLKFVLLIKLWDGRMKRFKLIASLYEFSILTEVILELFKVSVKLYQVTTPNGVEVTLLKLSGGTTSLCLAVP
jgi:hypothetical protein